MTTPRDDATRLEGGRYRRSTRSCDEVATLAPPTVSQRRTDVGPTSSSASTDGEPPKIGHYQILEHLGEGGMGIIYRAEDTRLGRIVAIKFLPPEFSDNVRAKSRFLREARAASQLDHPNICTIHEVGETEDGRLYMVMTCYEGESLRQRLDRGPLKIDEAVRVFAQVAAGLNQAHRHGIVHRDVKPANVFLAEEQVPYAGALPFRVKLLDFGIAKVEGDISLTRANAFVGTPAYMAPEQVMGQADQRSDIWALGVLLYEMLTGQLPFADREAYETASGTGAPALSDQRPDAPEFLCRIVARAMTWDPKGRYQSVADLTAELPITTEDSAFIARPSFLDPPVEGRHGPRRLAVAAFAAAMLLAIAVAAWIQIRERPDSAQNVVDASLAVAVLPFTVLGGEYDYLREGMVDLLSTKLDGAGDVRAIDPRVVFSKLAHEPFDLTDPAAGATAMSALGADLVVIGNLVELAGQVRIKAVLYRTEGGMRKIAEASEDGPVTQIFSLVDDLAAQLLASLDAGAGARVLRLAALTSESFPALKLYLEGESEWRDGHFAAAARAFEAAVVEDPEFALAWYRLSVARNWLLDVAGSDEAMRQAQLHADHLSPDDRRLLEIVDAYNHGDAKAAERLYLDVLSRRPDDLETWLARGEAEFHLGPLFGRSLRHSRRSWERVLELESEDRQALLHLMRIDLYEHDYEATATRARQLIPLLAESQRAAQPVIFLAMTPSAHAERARMREMLLGADLGIPWLTAGFTLSSGSVALETWESLHQELLTPERSPREQAFGRRHLGIFALARGRYAAADPYLRDAAHPPERDQEHRALAATVPFIPMAAESLDELASVVGAWPREATTDFSPFHPHSSIPDHHRLYVLALLEARRGHPERARALAGELARAADKAPGLGRDLVQGIHADLAFREGRYEQVLELLAERHSRASYELSMMSPIFSQARERYLKAESLRRLGRLEEALDWYETLSELNVFDLVYLGMAHARRAEIHEQLGHKELAAEHYRRFVELYFGCDEVALPQVEAARRKLQELG